MPGPAANSHSLETRLRCVYSKYPLSHAAPLPRSPPMLCLKCLATRTMRLAIVAAALSLALPSASTARADDTDQFQRVRDRIAKSLVDHNNPSIAVAVAKDGKIIWEQGFGWA